jgi:hypothetical protein
VEQRSGQRVFLAGWGIEAPVGTPNITTGEGFSARLIQTQMQILPLDACNRFYDVTFDDDTTWPSDQVCTTPLRRGGGAGCFDGGAYCSVSRFVAWWRVAAPQNVR